jgi:hypothetical protein
MKKILLLICIFLSSPCFAAVCQPKRDSHGKIKRSSYQVAQFKAHNVCPATNKIQKQCDGYIVDHKKPLCACGEDNWRTNMQWQTLEAGKQKDILEKAMCRGTGD